MPRPAQTPPRETAIGNGRRRQFRLSAGAASSSRAAPTIAARKRMGIKTVVYWKAMLVAGRMTPDQQDAERQRSGQKH